MNRNRKLQAAALVLSASAVVSASSGSVSLASPVAGVLASVASVSETFDSGYVSPVVEEPTAISGANLMLSNLVDMAENVAANEEMEELEVAEEVDVEDAEYLNSAIAKCDDYVNIRREASEDSELAGKLVANGGATVLGTEGDWTLIESGNVTGYVRSDFLTVGDEKLYYAHSRLYATVMADGLNVREDASTDAKRLTMAKEGVKLHVTDEMEENPEWIQVETSKGEGFIASEFVEVERRYNAVAVSVEEEAAQKAAAQAAIKAAERAKSQSKARSSVSSTPARSYSAPSGGSGSSIVDYALQFVGNPYRYGGTSLTAGADCSGFVMRVYGDCGVNGLPHSSTGLRNVGYGVSTEEMQPGDIVCYRGHVGIYAGNGNIVHASTRSTGIKVSSAFYREIVAVRRIF